MTRPIINKSQLLAKFRPSIVTAKVLTEARDASWKDTRSDGRFDVFLSHSHIDKEIILAFSKMLNSTGLKVYIDWIVDKDRGGKTITAENARIIRKRMKQCNTMIYLHTPNAAQSKWCPWEIGFFDAYRNEISVALISDTIRATTGQEYLELYPRFKASVNSVTNKYSFKKQLTASSNEEYVF